MICFINSNAIVHLLILYVTLAHPVIDMSFHIDGDFTHKHNCTYFRLIISKVCYFCLIVSESLHICYFAIYFKFIYVKAKLTFRVYFCALNVKRHKQERKGNYL